MGGKKSSHFVFFEIKANPEFSGVMTRIKELDHTQKSINQVRIYEIEIQTSIVLNN